MASKKAIVALTELQLPARLHQFADEWHMCSKRQHAGARYPADRRGMSGGIFQQPDERLLRED
jgi:hypothetical protein